MRVRLKEAALLTLPALADAVSLSDFSPRATDLPAACEALYTEAIPGCTASDFASGSTCTQACVQGLESLVQPIMAACSGKGVHGENLIVAFLANVGPSALCKNAPNWPGGHGPPGWTSSGTWSSEAATRTAGPTLTSGTSTASSLSPGDSSSLIVDTSSTPVSSIPASTTTTQKQKPSSTTSSTTTASSSSSSSPQSNTGDHSGGGSPFDTPGNLMAGAATLSFSGVVMLLSAGLTLFTALR